MLSIINIKLKTFQAVTALAFIINIAFASD